MIKIGITGGIGSGKTTVCKVFELLGVPVFYADTAAREVMVSDSTLVESIKSTFGTESYHPDGNLNRKHLAGIVFNSPEQLARLNAFVHPAVFRSFDSWVEKQESSYVIKEAALLFESRSYLDCNYTILVTSPLDLRVKRVMDRDKITEEEVLKRVARQLPDKEKEALASIVVVNNEQRLLIPQITALHDRFIREGR